MPFSNNTFDQDVAALLASTAARRVIDFGAGAGKYGRLARAVLPTAEIVCVEPESDYIKKYELSSVYDRVYREKIERFCLRRPDFVTDVAIFGDVIEHLPKSAGVDALHYIVYRCKLCLFVFPTKYVQYSWNGYAGEAHRSVWGAEDFVLFSHTMKTHGYMNLVAVRGYLDDAQAIIDTDQGAPKKRGSP